MIVFGTLSHIGDRCHPPDEEVAICNRRDGDICTNLRRVGYCDLPIITTDSARKQQRRSRHQTGCLLHRLQPPSHSTPSHQYHTNIRNRLGQHMLLPNNHPLRELATFAVSWDIPLTGNVIEVDICADNFLHANILCAGNNARTHVIGYDQALHGDWCPDCQHQFAHTNRWLTELQRSDLLLRCGGDTVDLRAVTTYTGRLPGVDATSVAVVLEQSPDGHPYQHVVRAAVDHTRRRLTGHTGHQQQQLWFIAFQDACRTYSFDLRVALNTVLWWEITPDNADSWLTSNNADSATAANIMRDAGDVINKDACLFYVTSVSIAGGMLWPHHHTEHGALYLAPAAVGGRNIAANLSGGVDPELLPVIAELVTAREHSSSSISSAGLQVCCDVAALLQPATRH
jgi:hypothetical protein